MARSPFLTEGKGFIALVPGRVPLAGGGILTRCRAVAPSPVGFAAPGAQASAARPHCPASTEKQAKGDIEWKKASLIAKLLSLHVHGWFGEMRQNLQSLRLIRRKVTVMVLKKSSFDSQITLLCREDKKTMFTGAHNVSLLRKSKTKNETYKSEKEPFSFRQVAGF